MTLPKRILGQLSSALRMRHSEYRASFEGLNIFFGAVLGVSLGGIDTMPTQDFMVLLAVVSGIVMTILYISSVAERRIFYSLVLIGLLILLQLAAERGDPDGFAIPDKLIPTLIVWASIALLTEFTPREPRPKAD